MDYEALPPVDVLLPTTPDEAVPSLLAALGGAKARKPAAVKTKAEPTRPRAVRCGSMTWRSRSRPRSATVTSRSPTCRSPGTAPSGRSVIRSITSARRAAAASAADPACRSARRSRSRARDGCRSPSAETATSSWARPRSGPRCITAFRSWSWSATTARSSTTNSTRSASPASATGRSRTAGSASASRIRTSIARRWGKRRAPSGSTPSPSARSGADIREGDRGGRGRSGGCRRCAGRARLCGDHHGGDAARDEK